MIEFLRKAAQPAAVWAASLLVMAGTFIWLLGRLGPDGLFMYERIVRVGGHGPVDREPRGGAQLFEKRGLHRLLPGGQHQL